MASIASLTLLSLAVGVPFPNMFANDQGTIIYREAYGWTFEYEPEHVIEVVENDLNMNASSKCRESCFPPSCKGYTFAMDPRSAWKRAHNNKCVLLKGYTRVVYATIDKNADHRFEQRAGYIVQDPMGPGIDQCQDIPTAEFPCRNKRGRPICTPVQQTYHCRKTCGRCNGHNEWFYDEK